MGDYIKLTLANKQPLYVRKWDLISFTTVTEDDRRHKIQFITDLSKIQLPSCKNVDDCIGVMETVDQIKEMLGIVDE